ncbi:amino acid kinase family protein [Rhizobium grahamii]|uniref:1-pyrroline-5-carboxylate synthetase n=2 Tax=Rhizobium grahamii TaxID=1120045 RepID=S3H4N0_9HYPH|nr:1-pyrroline-5-carboxylate synthetase [Rhizobium grahamii]EPE93709.1 1-pyrroline-5-carboxylate synthetase [Rhizobium grahamii CCGE 502]RDJ01984.1 aspartate kinase [Rhizobium grahamii]
MCSTGFTPYGFSLVVKFGGSLMRDIPTCKDAIAELERLVEFGYRILLVPGGGLPDKAIEAVDASYPLAAFTSHHACALAQDQTGYLLTDRAFSSKLVATSALGECRKISAAGMVPVLLPSRILFAMDPVDWSWDVTSDAVATWIAWVTGAASVAFLTDVDGVYRSGGASEPAELIQHIDAADLARLGHTCIDACAAQFMAARGLTGVVVNGSHANLLRDWLDGKPVKATCITASGNRD